MNPINNPIGFIVFWGLTLIATGIFLLRGVKLWKLLAIGKEPIKPGQFFKRIIPVIADMIIQECQFKNIRKKDRAGIGHLFMVWGFLLFVTYYFFFIVIAFGFGLSEKMENNVIYTIYAWVMDFAAAFVFLGALWGIIRRYFFHPKRLEGQRTWEALFILITVLLHPFTHVGKIATQIAAGEAPVRAGFAAPPISNLASNLFSNPVTVDSWHTLWFWSHWAFVLLVLAIIGYTRYLHVPAAIINDILRGPKKGELSLINLEDPSTFGVDRVDKYTQKQLLDTYACVVCGYCQDACPATNTNKPLNPRLIIRDVKTNLMNNGPLIQNKQEPTLPLIGGGKDGSIDEDAIWSCTTCWACMEVCPVYIEHVPKIVDLRRYLVQMQSKFPEELLNFFENIEQRSNPWGIAPGDRPKWTTGIEVKPFEAGKTEYLFYVGCFGSFDNRSKQVTLAIAKLLNAAGVSWGILGKDEKCCGDSLRRLGNEYVFDRMAKDNIKMYQDKGITKIVTQCPHCFTTLKNDYAQYGAKLEVFHHTELINELIKQGKIKLNWTDLGKIVFHDSCYLGRHNQIYQPPRETVAAATGKAPAEMERNLKRGFCCGAGGGRMWLEESLGTRINNERTAEALQGNPNVICTCCPYCMTMFQDGLKDKNKDKEVQVLDIAEVVLKALN